MRRAAVLLLLVAVCVGCGAPTPAPAPPAATSAAAPAPNAPALPPRPREVRLDSVDACGLLTPALRTQLDLNPVGDPAPTGDELKSADCQWTNSPRTPGVTLKLRLVLDQDTAFYLQIPEATVTRVAGFAAIDLPGQFMNPQYSCTARVDVAAGQSLWVIYSNLDGRLPGSSYELMCRNAHTAAEGVLERLLG